MDRRITKEFCSLCERTVSNVSLHHLVPKEEGGRHGPTIPLCQPCHSTIHLIFSNRELAKEYDSVEKLKAAPALKKYLNWIRRRNIEKISNRRSKQ